VYELLTEGENFYFTLLFCGRSANMNDIPEFYTAPRFCIWTEKDKIPSIRLN